MSDRHSHNLAARMAHWSGRHRKKGFFGWLAFAILAFATVEEPRPTPVPA
jgi:hypothetical protein